MQSAIPKHIRLIGQQECHLDLTHRTSACSHRLRLQPQDVHREQNHAQTSVVLIKSCDYLQLQGNHQEENHAQTPVAVMDFKAALQSLGQNSHLLDVAIDAMEQLTIAPSPNAYLSLLKACMKRHALPHVKRIGAHVTRHNVELTGLLGDYLVIALAKCGGVNDAYDIFTSLPLRNVFTWTAIIGGFVQLDKGQEALRMYQYMLDEGIEPNDHTFVSVFKACGSICDIQQGKRLHADARRTGFSADVYVGSTLVSMYGKCGSIIEAEDVFNALSVRSVVTWNAMLSVFVEVDQGEKALWLYRQMQEEAVQALMQTFLIVLQACGTLAKKNYVLEGCEVQTVALKISQALHADAQRAGATSEAFVANSLVTTYGKCGSILEAQQAFNNLSFCSVVSWNAILSVFVEQGQGEKALQLYRQMQEEGFCPSQPTFVIALQACSALAEDGDTLQGKLTNTMLLDIGQAVHVDAQYKCFHQNVFICNTLVSFYGRCGRILEAENLFDTLCQRNLVSWNVMLGTYVEQGQGERALKLYKQMQEEGVFPNQQTMKVTFQACVTLLDSEETFHVLKEPVKIVSFKLGQALHADAWRMGLISDAFAGSSLVNLYGKCGNIIEAEHVFDSLSQHDVVSWSVMLSAYVEQLHGDKGLQLYRQMHEEAVNPDEHTFVIALQACGTLIEKEDATTLDGKLRKVSWEICRALHADAQRKGFTSDAFVGSTLVSIYGKCGSILEAESMFDGLFVQDIIAWNVMISRYFELGEAEKALQLYRQMLAEGMSPNQPTFLGVLQACGSLAEKGCTVALEIGRALHADAGSKGLTSDTFLGSALVSMYGKCGSIGEAQKVFEELSQGDVVLWNALLSAYIEQDQGEKALDLYKKMQEACRVLNDATIICLLRACCDAGNMEICRQTHFIIASAIYSLDPFIMNTLIHAYGNCAGTEEAQAVFDALLSPTIVSWNACIAGYAREGNLHRILQVFEEMQHAGVEADEVASLLLLAASSHTGVVDKGVEHLNGIHTNSGLCLDMKHFISMIDLCGRAGDFQKVENLLQGMPMQLDLVGWLSLLNACRTHGNVEVGKHAFHHAVDLQPKLGFAYVLLSNMFADGEFDKFVSKENLEENILIHSDVYRAIQHGIRQ